MDIQSLEARIAQLEAKLEAIANSNNQLADIAFDENRFTEWLLNKVDEVARESAKEEVDVDEIAREAAQYVDLDDNITDAVDSELNHRNVLTRSEVEDVVKETVEEYLNDNGFIDADATEQLIDDYVTTNYEYVERSEIEGIVKEVLEEEKETT